MNSRIALVGLHFFFSHWCVCVVQHLLFSVTEPQFRVKPAGVSDVSFFFLVNIVVGSFFYHFLALANCGNSLWLVDHVGGGNGEA